MKILLIALVAVLSCTAAHAGSMVCDAPQILFTSDARDYRDPNPVISTEVDHVGDQWSILHHLASGAVVARGDQYAVADVSDGSMTQWTGRLFKNRGLVMTGRAWVNTKTGEGGYEEWLYNVSQGNRLDMHAVSKCRVNLGRLELNAAAPQGRLRSDPVEDRPLLEAYQVPMDISGGRLNMRNGPGVNYALVGAVPAGSVLRGKAPIECRPREDGIRGADWCHIGWNGVDGWVSRAGMMPIN
jgi:hypothetical protein